MKLCGVVKPSSVYVHFQCYQEQPHLSKLYFSIFFFFKNVFILTIYILNIEIPASTLFN